MRSDFTTITPERVEEHILVLYLDRPERANAMNTQMGIELRAFFQDMYVDQDGVRVVIVTGRGAKAFSAGGDLKDRNGMTDQQWQHQHAIYEQMVRGLRDCPVPVRTDIVTLTVNEKPEIVTQPTPVTLCSGEDATFTVDAGVTTNPVSSSAAHE